MATYANATCSKCGLQLPRNLFHEWDEEIETTRKSTTYRKYANGRVGVQQGGSTYKIDHQLLCPDCYSNVQAAIAAEAARRAAIAEHEAHSRRLMFLVVSVVILCGIIAVAWNGVNNRPSETTTSDTVSAVANTPGVITNAGPPEPLPDATGAAPVAVAPAAPPAPVVTAPTPSLDTNSAALTAPSSTVPSSGSTLLLAFHEADQACDAHYASDHANQDCQDRDRLARQLNAEGLCWSWLRGEKVWHRCRDSRRMW